MKKVLLTGGSGFLGRHVAEAARQRGCEVFAPSRRQLDLESADAASACMDELLKAHSTVDVIVHAAAYCGGIAINQAEPAAMLCKNCRMGLNVFELARRYHVPKVLAVGSACAYPGSGQGDLREESFRDGPPHESVEAYGFAKRLLLAAQRAYHAQHGIESNHLVLASLFGPHDAFDEYRSHVVAAMIRKFTAGADKVVLWGDGSAVREFLYVEDAAEAIVRAIDLDHDLVPLNVGTGVGTSTRALAELIAKLTGFAGRIEWDATRPAGTSRKVLDVTRMRQRLGWSPQWPLERRLAETIEWYRANGPAGEPPATASPAGS